MLDTKRILVVDDEPNICQLLVRILEKRQYLVTSAHSGAEALRGLDPSISLVLLDVNMPGMSGLDALACIRSQPEVGDVPVIIMTGLPTAEARETASSCGADDFICKPFDNTEVMVRVRAVLERRASQEDVRRRQVELEGLVDLRTAALQQALNESLTAQNRLQEAHLESLRRLAVAAEYKDELTGNHIQRVGSMSALLGRALGLPEREVELLQEASTLHDVGKIGIPDDVLHKPGRLDEAERAVMQRHTIIGSRILGRSKAEIVQMASTIALTHHEWWNGEGYPTGLRGESIAVHGRICAVADVFDALTSRRPYKEPWSNERAVQVIRESSGKQFDPGIVSIFLNSLDQIVEIQGRFSDALAPDTPERMAFTRPALAATGAPA